MASKTDNRDLIPAIALVGMAVIYFFVSLFLGKFLLLAVVLWLLFSSGNFRRERGFFIAMLAGLVFSGAFLLNPVYQLFSLKFPDWATVCKLLVPLFFMIAGGLWLWLCFPKPPPAQRPEPIRLSLFPFLIFLLVLLALFVPSWIQDLAYGGDENYHTC